MIHAEGRPCEQVLVEVIDPPNAYPDYGPQTAAARLIQRRSLADAGVGYSDERFDLLSPDSNIADMLSRALGGGASRTLIIDISALPKRFFCLFVKLACVDERATNVIAIYTEAGRGGYPEGRLTDDALPFSPLPGFMGAFGEEPKMLLASVGMQAEKVEGLVDEYRNANKHIHVLLGFPSDVTMTGRAWETVRAIFRGDVSLARDAVDVVSTLDVQDVFDVIERQVVRYGRPRFAPYGPKPHTLAMCLSAMKHDAEMTYGQPRSYHPAYSTGVGPSWGYVLKWNGRPTFD